MAIDNGKTSFPFADRSEYIVSMCPGPHWSPLEWWIETVSG